MKDNNQLENERAFRIALRLNNCHISLTSIYESLVDREFDDIEKETKRITMEMKFILKSIKDDDF
jgi:hypothetical protein